MSKKYPSYEDIKQFYDWGYCPDADLETYYELGYLTKDEIKKIKSGKEE